MAVKIGVLLKQVPDTNSRILIKDGKIDEADLKFVINPYDEFAIEEAIKTKDAWKTLGVEAETVGICLGASSATKVLRDALAVGLDRGILIVDNEKKASDPRATSQALAQIAKEENFQLIFAGKQAVDTDSHAVAVMVAERLQLPHVSVVSKLEWKSATEARVERDVEGGVKEIYALTLPALISANKGLNKMRLASLPGIRAAAKKEVKEVSLPGVSSGYRVSAWELPPERGAVKMISGDAATQAAALVKALREEAKVI